VGGRGPGQCNWPSVVPSLSLDRTRPVPGCGMECAASCRRVPVFPRVPKSRVPTGNSRAWCQVPLGTRARSGAGMHRAATIGIARHQLTGVYADYELGWVIEAVEDRHTPEQDGQLPLRRAPSFRVAVVEHEHRRLLTRNAQRDIEFVMTAGAGARATRQLHRCLEAGSAARAAKRDTVCHGSLSSSFLGYNPVHSIYDQM
jgi:hypothetical protein